LKPFVRDVLQHKQIECSKTMVTEAQNSPSLKDASSDTAHVNLNPTRRNGSESGDFRLSTTPGPMMQ
jgi:hypothetical protein